MRPDRERLHDSHGQSLPGPHKVAEIMSSPVRVLSDEDSFEDAATLMLQESVGAVPICSDGQLVGILTETDVLKAYRDRFKRDGAPKESTVRARMKQPVKSVTSDTKVDDALDVIDHDTRHLIVVDEDCMTGILSERDLLLGLSQEITIDERAQSEGRYAETDLPVQSIMSRQVVSVGENDVLSRAAQLMIGNKFSALPVLDPAGSVVGIVTQRDIIEEYVARLDG
jgi:CBS-domain-containing membrane protein